MTLHFTARAENLPDKQHTLLSASELDYPPFAIILQDGTAGGFSVDLLRAAVEAAGLSVTFKVGPWHELKQQLADGTLDVLPLVSYSKERDKMYDFTTPYLKLSGTVFVRKGNNSIHTLSDLKDKEVLVMEGDTAQEYVQREKLSDTVISTVSYEEAFRLLASGKHDAVVVQHIVGLQIIKTLHLVNIVPVEQKQISSFKPVTLKLEGFEQNFCFAVPEGKKQLLALLNEGLAIISLNGTYNTLYEKWFAPILPKPHVSLSALIKQIVSILGPLLLVLTLLGLWYLKRQVSERTKHLESEIRQRKAIEGELAKANATYVKAQELGKVGNWEYNTLNRELRGSAEAKKIFGLNVETPAFSTEEIKSCIPERERVRQALVDLVGRNLPFNLEFDILAKDSGERRTIMSSAQAERDEAGNLLEVHGVIQDITAHRKAERNYQTLFREMCEGFALHEIILDDRGAPADYRFLSVNPSFERLTGLKAETILGRTVLEILPGTEKYWIDTYGRVALTGEPAHFENYSVELKKYFEITSFRSAQNQFACIMTDITDRKKVEEEREVLQSQLIQAQKMEAIGTLAGGIAHDFNNILGVMIGYAEMVREDSAPESLAAQDLEQVLVAGNRAKELVKQILTFSRQTKTKNISFQPAILVKETIKLLRASIPTTIAIEQDVDMHCDLLLADPTQVQQIIMNLCTNAYQAMEENGGTLSITLEKKLLTTKDLAAEPNAQPGRFVVLSIGDTGTGIRPDNLNKIFDPYFTTKELGKGTGMGLATTHGIVKSYGGFISCESRLGEGTIFRIYLPSSVESRGPESIETESIVAGSEHILLVDDEEMLAEMTRTMLERLGYSVTLRGGSLEALTTFENQPDSFDLVITDQTMPGVTGVDMARRMLQIRPGLPIILCTGYSSSLTEEKALSLGIKGFTLKPLTKKDISSLIRQVLDK